MPKSVVSTSASSVTASMNLGQDIKLKIMSYDKLLCRNSSQRHEQRTRRKDTRKRTGY